uniref:Discoidin, CUB and LCCL domain containing 2 n=1 Tax=Electrophorus electricus TaxID=8005 RepID=A0A4W4EZ95_ELEEL
MCVVGDGCGHTLLGPGSGSLASLGYPLSYPTHSVCEWEIRERGGHTLILHVADLDIDTQNCQVSYLRLFNGIGVGRTEIGERGGPRVVESASHQVTVQFMSGPHDHGRGFFLSYASSEYPDLITCLEKGNDFTEAEFSKFCPAGCLTDFGEVSGTIPHGYRDSSGLCLAAIHAGVVSNSLGGKVSVVSSTGIPHYDSTLANNVTSAAGTLSPSLFTFKTSGCYGTLGLESGVVSDSQISTSSVWEWGRHGDEPSVWAPSGARLKRAGLPWAAAHGDTKQWIQVDLKREKKITGIITSGSTLPEHQFYVSTYRVHYSNDGQDWNAYQDVGSDQDKVFQGNTNYLQEVRNNFIPPIEARFIRISPSQWNQRISLKMELLGCQLHIGKTNHMYVKLEISGSRPAVLSPNCPDDNPMCPVVLYCVLLPEMALVAVLVPVLVVVLTAPVLLVVCTWLWKSRSAPHTLHWMGRNVCVIVLLLQLTTRDHESSLQVYTHTHIQPVLTTHMHIESIVGILFFGHCFYPVLSVSPEYAQPLVSGTMTSLGQRSTFKPEEGADPEYDAPLTPEQYHAYAEPLPASGAEYAIPITTDRANHISGGALPFCGHGIVAQTDCDQSGTSMYDTPKNMSDQAAPTEGQLYQVPQNSSNTPCQEID